MEDGFEQSVANLAQEDLHTAVELYEEKASELGDEARSVAYTAKELYGDLEETEEEFDRFARGLADYLLNEAEVVDDATVEVQDTLAYLEDMRSQIGDFSGVPDEAKEATDSIHANNEEWFGDE